MKSVSIYLFITVLATAASGQQNVINDANVQQRIIPAFHAVHVSGAVDLFLSQGNEDAVAVSASEIKYRDNIKTEVKDGVLRIWYDNAGHGFSMGGKKMRAYVSVKMLDRLDAAGASD